MQRDDETPFDWRGRAQDPHEGCHSKRELIAACGRFWAAMPVEYGARPRAAAARPARSDADVAALIRIGAPAVMQARG